jgi:hypothetical protein
MLKDVMLITIITYALATQHLDPSEIKANQMDPWDYHKFLTKIIGELPGGGDFFPLGLLATMS